MAKKHSSAPRKPLRKTLDPQTNLIFHDARHGLLVSTKAQFPETVDLKITCAKNIVQAVVAAQDHVEGMNYDIHWPLSVAVQLLEDAQNQFGQEQLAQRRARRRVQEMRS